VKPFNPMTIYVCMCEHVIEVAEACIRANSIFPPEVEEHRLKCASCAEYVAFTTLISMTGRPHVQLPSVELTNKIASLTYAKQSVWQQLLTKPAVFAPALGVLAVAGWLLSGVGDSKNIARVNTNVDIISSLAVRERPPLDISQRSKPDQRSGQPVRSIADRIAFSARPVSVPVKARRDIERMSDTNIRKVSTLAKISLSIPQNSEIRVSDVISSDITSVRTSRSRVPELSIAADHTIDVQAPSSSRHALGRSSLVLASTDEVADTDDLRASFQSQLNQQSDAFRNTNVQPSQPIGDSARINVVNAPVGNGGK
jgi:hypothetical protein